MMHSRELLELLRTPPQQYDSNPRKYIGEPSRAEIRPLGSFSAFVCEELGYFNQEVADGDRSPRELFAQAEWRLSKVPDSVVERLFEPDAGAPRRVAALDLVWVLRALDIACGGEPDYAGRKRDTHLFTLASRLAGVERRNPVLSWSDIAIYHPVGDPRTFLRPGRARDEEILMYRTQHAIEQLFRDIITTDWTTPTETMVATLLSDIRTTVKGLVHYSRARTLGQFYQLDPYLCPNGEYRGHATGAFSVWTFLMAIFLAGNASYRRRLCDPANRMAFDSDGWTYIDQVRDGRFRTLSDHLMETPDEVAEARVLFTAFLASHRGAIRRHAPTSFAYESPTDPARTNGETIAEALADMTADVKVVIPVENTQPVRDPPSAPARRNGSRSRP